MYMFYLFIYFIIVCVYLYMHMYNFLCSDSLLYTVYFFLFLSTLHGVYTRDCSCTLFLKLKMFTAIHSSLSSFK